MTILKRERDLRNYLAGGALAFGVVLLVSQILLFAFGGLPTEELEAIFGLLTTLYLSSHVVGGFIGGYLVARRRRFDYIMTGTVTAIIAYIFEFIYNLVVERALTDIWALFSLLIGGILGSMFYRAKNRES